MAFHATHRKCFSWLTVAMLAACAVANNSTLRAQDGGSAPDSSSKTNQPSKESASKGSAALIKPTSGTAQSSQPRAVCTFESVGLYWTPDGAAASKTCQVQYRQVDEKAWHEALPLWFDERNGEYRGSIVRLHSDTKYDVRLELSGGGPVAELKAATWSETFPIARTIHVEDMTGQTLTVDQSGTPQGYVLYTHRPGAATATLDGADKIDLCVDVKASHVILRGLTLRKPKIHGIVLGAGSHDVVIEECDISGWGRTAPDGFGIDYDSAVYSKLHSLARVVIQRNRMHDPRSNSNTWQESREGFKTRHPMGPQAISFFDSDGNHVFRYNEFTTDDNHFCNDIFGGGPNRSLRGFPGADSDVYANHLQGCWDDALEMEGGGCNVRVWGNYMERALVKIAIAGVHVGPIYVFRNVSGSSRMGHQGFGGGPLVKMGEAPLTGGGRAYIFHNTILQPPALPGSKELSGCSEGLSKSGGPELLSVVSRNNILHMRNSSGKAVRDASEDAHEYDFDLIFGEVVAAGKQEQHAVHGAPVYAVPGSTGDFSLAPGSPGFDAGERLPNFNDGFHGQGPDMGACEAGSPPLEFGVNAYRSTPKLKSRRN